MKTHKKLWIAIGILALFSPLGVVLPALFGAGGAWGEWSLAEIEKLVGFVPDGMRRFSEIWKAPLQDYTVPRQGSGIVHTGMGYLLAGLIGFAATAVAAYLIGKLLARRERNGGSE